MSICANVPKESGLLIVYKALKDRSTVMLNADNLDTNVISQHLTSQRNDLRKELCKQKIIRSINEYESLYMSSLFIYAYKQHHLPIDNERSGLRSLYGWTPKDPNVQD